MESLTKGLSLTDAIKNDVNVKNIHKIINRIKKYERQISYQYNDSGIRPAKALKELDRLKNMEKYYRTNYLIVNDIQIQRIKTELNQWLTIKQHWIQNTNREYIQYPSNLTAIQEAAIEVMQSHQIKANIARLSYRVNLALKQAIYERQHIIMNTLTVKPENYHKVFDKGSTSFKNYIKKFNEILDSDNHQYFAITELGGRTGRPHLHVIHILKEIPENWKQCPNTSTIQPTHRVINNARSYWKHGFSAPIAVRINAADIWNKYRFRWPVKYNEITKEYIPIPTGNSGKLTSYLVKYLTKQLPKKDVPTWKIRISNQLGMTIFNKTMQQLNQKLLSKIMSIAIQQTLILHGKIIPTKILKKAASKEIILRLRKSNNTTQLMTLEPQSSLMRRLQTMTLPTPMYNLVNTTDSKIRKLKKVETSELIQIQNIIDKYVIKYTGTLDIQATSGMILKAPSSDRL